MSGTFYGCSSLVDAPNIPNSIKYMGGTFQNCSSLVNAPEIPSNVIDMKMTFQECTNLTGDILIHSEYIQDASYCFDYTSLDKNVYIPFNFANNVDYTSWYAWEGDDGNKYYTKEDFYNTTNETGSWASIDLYNDSFDGTGQQMIFAPWETYPYYASLYNISSSEWVRVNFTYNSANNVIIHKDAGDSTFTYDAFINAGYGTDPDNRVNGVCLFDINA